MSRLYNHDMQPDAEKKMGTTSAYVERQVYFIFMCRFGAAAKVGNIL